MDKIFYNGLIKTVDDAYPYVEAVAVNNGVITYLGKYEDVIKHKTDDTEMIDLEGKFMYPGFMDCHMHLITKCVWGSRIWLGDCKSFKEAMDLLRAGAEKIRAAGSDAWVTGSNFNENDWADRPEIPSRLDLDEAVGDIPCYIQRACGHMMAFNTAALEVCGMMDERRETTKLDMKFFPDGTPLGHFFEGSKNFYTKFETDPTVEDYKAMIEKETKEYAKHGLVAIHSDDFNRPRPEVNTWLVLQAFKEVAEEGKLGVRVYEQCRCEKADLLKEFVTKYPRGTKFGKNGMFETVSVKQMVDGSLGAHSAIMRNGYLNDPDAASVKIHEDEELFELVDIANEGGYPVVAHCIGDGAVEQLLNAFDYAMERHPGADLRNGIVHCQVMGFDQLDRMQMSNIVGYIQPIFTRADADIVEDCVGPEVAAQSYNWAKMKELGIHMASGSDCPVENNDPINNLYYAVTRDNGKGKAWRPENGLSMEDAIRTFTIEGAYAAHEEAQRGSISAGKFADFVVLDRNLMEIDPWTVRDTKVLMTVIDGEIVYKAE